MKILKFDEQEDGSAILQVEITQEENMFYVEYAITDIIQKYIEKEKDADIIRATVPK